MSVFYSRGRAPIVRAARLSSQARAQSMMLVSSCSERMDLLRKQSLHVQRLHSTAPFRCDL